MQPVIAHPESPLKAWCSAWLAEVELFREVRRIEKNEESAENKVRNIIDLLDTMDPDFIPADRPIDERLHRYLEHISLDRDNEDSEEDLSWATVICDKCGHEMISPRYQVLRCWKCGNATHKLSRFWDNLLKALRFKGP